MNKPCPHCPFRMDIPAFIRPERGEEIWESLERGAMFPCHKTVDYSNDDDEGAGRVTGDSQFCAGALILMEREWEDQGGAMMNQMVRICVRVGQIDLGALSDEGAPVAGDLESWIDYLTEGDL